MYTMSQKIRTSHRIFCLIFIALLAMGCGSLLPSSKQTTKSPWNSFEDAKTSFDKIVPFQTTAKEMKELGFDPFSSPNIEILTYVDIMNLFMPNPSINMEDLDEGIRSCIKAKSACTAYEFDPQMLRTERHGNVLLDLFNFQRKTAESGWRFEALIVLVNDTVAYKIWGGSPIINTQKDSTNPLGPLQNSGDMIMKAVSPNF
jgi:hypothetical protein